MPELPLEQWRDFYVMVGTAAVTIVGATFIVATLAGDRLPKEREIGFRGFITPSAVHLGAVLIISAVLTMPSLDDRELAGILGIGGLLGAAYGLLVVWRILHMGIARLDLDDRIFHMTLPLVSYAGLAAAGYLAWQDAHECLQCVAIALLALLIIGMRNAWDMASFMLMRDPNTPPPKT